jgi:hypothetical protein
MLVPVRRAAKANPAATLTITAIEVRMSARRHTPTPYFDQGKGK